ncbi:MAG: 2-oxoacid:acceptor oxidoreductase family protein [Desulfotomaculum sp.]|nr:2-oxoacid:acceptor oxidoreductase family protein [Desulfotomaculum sp.]
MAEKTWIRMSGLGGQGVITCAHILATAANQEGKESTVNPFFGAEKRLAPAESYVRISSEVIHERGEILKPDIIMIFHPHVITLGKCYTMPFYEGLQPGGNVIINSDQPLAISKEDLEKLNQMQAKVFYVSATQIASEVGGTELSTNMAMLGALLGVAKVVSFDAVKFAVQDRFGGKNFVASGSTAALDDVMKSKFAKVTQLIEKNMNVVEEASKRVEEYQL